MLLLCGMVIENTLGGVPSQPASMPALDTTALREAVSAYIDERDKRRDKRGQEPFPAINARPPNGSERQKGSGTFSCHKRQAPERVGKGS